MADARSKYDKAYDKIRIAEDKLWTVGLSEENARNFWKACQAFHEKFPDMKFSNAARAFHFKFENVGSVALESLEKEVNKKDDITETTRNYILAGCQLCANGFLEDKYKRMLRWQNEAYEKSPDDFKKARAVEYNPPTPSEDLVSFERSKIRSGEDDEEPRLSAGGLFDEKKLNSISAENKQWAEAEQTLLQVLKHMRTHFESGTFTRAKSSLRDAQFMLLDPETKATNKIKVKSTPYERIQAVSVHFFAVINKKGDAEKSHHNFYLRIHEALQRRSPAEIRTELEKIDAQISQLKAAAPGKANP